MAKATRKKSTSRAKKKSSQSTSAKKRTTKRTAAKKKTTKKRVAKKRVAKKSKVGTKKKATRKKATKKKVAKKKTAKKKVAKKKAAKKTTKKKAAKKKTTKRKVGKKRRKSSTKAAVAPISIEATRLTIALRQAEEAAAKVSARLSDAKDKVASATMTARLKGSDSAHAAADRAREAAAALNARRVDLTDRLKAASDSFKAQHKVDLDLHKREQALKDLLARTAEKFNKAFDRKIASRGKKRRKTKAK